VTRRPLKDVAASVHQRLLNRAREIGRPFNELLQYYAMERFLYRLSRTRHAGKFILKGALVFRAWHASLSRPTKDIDFLGRLRNDLRVVAAAVGDACRQEVEPDGMTFDAESVEAISIVEEGDSAGVRVRLRGALANARVSLQVDVGFGDVVTPAAEAVMYPTILDFPSPRLRGYSRESAIAEKFHTMVKLRSLNSRMKDFYDVWVLLRRFDFDGRVLATAIRRTFANRQAEVPSRVVAFDESFANDPTKTTQWTAFARRSRLGDAPQSFGDVVASVAAFLAPVAVALSQGQPFRKVWHAGGSWVT